MGTGAALDCARALRENSILDRGSFRSACLITMAKSPEDVTRLGDAFDLYWSTYIDPAEGKTPLAVSAPRSLPQEEIASATETTPMRIGVDGGGVVRVGRYSPDAPSTGHEVTPLGRGRLLAIRSGVRRLRRQMATRPGRREGPARHGAIDFSATARHSLRQGGEWIELRFRRRRKRLAELVVLWDVSGSMRDHETTLFALVHALQRGIRRTRVFAFGTRIEEVTNLLRGRSYAHAAQAISSSLQPMGGGTRIGICLVDFLRRHAQLVNGRTTVVVLSDGWDLGDTAHLSEALRRIHRLSHLLVWVNPHADDPRFEPATAGMQAALPHVDLLLGPADFESRTGFAAERVAARHPNLRSAGWRKAYIAAPR